jgi:hypothetical protein
VLPLITTTPVTVEETSSSLNALPTRTSVIILTPIPETNTTQFQSSSAGTIAWVATATMLGLGALVLFIALISISYKKRKRQEEQALMEATSRIARVPSRTISVVDPNRKSYLESGNIFAVQYGMQNGAGFGSEQGSNHGNKPPMI